MSTYPRFEARISAIERRQLNTDARVEELSGEITTGFKQLAGDMEGSFKQLTEYLAKTEEQIEERLNKIETDIVSVKTTLDQYTTRFDHLEALLTQILKKLP